MFGFQPLTKKNAEAFVVFGLLIALVYFIPKVTNLYIDALWRSSLFLLAFGGIALIRKYSEEVNQLWFYWGKRLFGSR
jgi:hypothetical protein